jgi:hypothetical protein
MGELNRSWALDVLRDYVTDFGAGDLTGLAALGRSACPT